MEELIKITDTKHGHLVNAKDLHAFLEVETRFDKWIKRMIEYGFEEGQDFCPFLTESNGGRPSTHYGLKLDMAKEISMIQRSEKGRQARRYFIACEKKLVQYSLPQSYTEALAELLETARELESSNTKLIEAQTKIEDDSPKVIFAETVKGSDNSILVRQFAKNLCDEGFEIGQNRLFEWLRSEKYLNASNEPYQNYVDMGVFEVVTRAVGSASGTFTTQTTKITGKGQIYFTKKIREQYIED